MAEETEEQQAIAASVKQVFATAYVAARTQLKAEGIPTYTRATVLETRTLEIIVGAMLAELHRELSRLKKEREKHAATDPNRPLDPGS